ncbi:hypothetical protein FDUTEX481_08342 [Tolypothrix sp. PCC 7601]|nr:hypothetical protein FDUTEX481_08342 [Tolypothrix sp. PCC 7601]
MTLTLFPLPFSQITREMQNTYPNRIGYPPPLPITHYPFPIK